jgi:hypothetical protein
MKFFYAISLLGAFSLLNSCSLLTRQLSAERCEDTDPITCDGQIEHKCEQGVLEFTDCSDADKVCVNVLGCQEEALCGNGVLDAGEVCDDGNQDNDDACINNCQKSVAEECDNIDNDGNGQTDEGCDDDGDGFCDDQATVAAGGADICPNTPPGGNGDDCNDNDEDTNPGAHELCDGIDQDCDGLSDISTDANADQDTDDTCGALVCLDFLGVIDCACNNDAQCSTNGGGQGETCDEADGSCFCKGGSAGNHGVRGQGCSGDTPVNVCSVDEDCGNQQCNGGNIPNQFCN